MGRVVKAKWQVLAREEAKEESVDFSSFSFCSHLGLLPASEQHDTALYWRDFGVFVVRMALDAFATRERETSFFEFMEAFLSMLA